MTTFAVIFVRQFLCNGSPVPKEGALGSEQSFPLHPEGDLHGEGDQAEPVRHVSDQPQHQHICIHTSVKLHFLRFFVM
jgi:hypothetical protein